MTSVASSVCELFKTRIRQGELKAGDLFPPIRTIASDHHLAHATAVRVVERLIQEGYIERIGRRPAVVRGVPARTMTIGIVYGAEEANFRHPASVKLLYSLGEACLPHGHRIQLLPVRNEHWSNVIDFAREVQRTSTGGLLTFGGIGLQAKAIGELVSALRGFQIPIVQLETKLHPQAAWWPLVASNFYDVGIQAVGRLRAYGRHRIGAIVGPWATIQTPHSLLQGVFVAMNTKEVCWNESQYERVSQWSETAGEQAMARLLDKAEIDAVICQDDLCAVGAMRMLESRGLTVPEDVALIGVGDLLSPDASAKLSTFDPQYHQLAVQAISLLEQQSDGQKQIGTEVTIPPVYLSRQTCPGIDPV